MAVTVAVAAAKFEGFDNDGSVLAFIMTLRRTNSELKACHVPTGRYVVYTSRVIATDSVIVATSGYVVPAAYDISPGRVK
ncbi:hypothetical protein Tco_0945428 [Tanacetum coccineum]